MTSIKETYFYDILRDLKWKYINYFSDQGVLRRNLYYLFSNHDPLVQSRLRKKIYNQVKEYASQESIAIAHELKEKGYLFLNFDHLGFNAQDLNQFTTTLAHDFNEAISQDPRYLERVPQSKYDDITIAYDVYHKSKSNDPLLELVFNKKLLDIATLYIGYLPLIEETSFCYTPVHNRKQFGSQLWHRDTQHKRILKLFFSPFEILAENGPFQFYSPDQSTLKYYKYFPQAMSDAQIEKSGLSIKNAMTFLAKPNHFLLVDTTRCLHRGGCTQKPRFMSTISFSSPIYSFFPKQYRNTGTYRFSFEKFKLENERLLAESQRL